MMLSRVHRAKLAPKLPRTRLRGEVEDPVAAVEELVNRDVDQVGLDEFDVVAAAQRRGVVFVD